MRRGRDFGLCISLLFANVPSRAVQLNIPEREVEKPFRARRLRMTLLLGAVIRKAGLAWEKHELDNAVFSRHRYRHYHSNGFRIIGDGSEDAWC